jgi:hypothetical protein
MLLELFNIQPYYKRQTLIGRKSNVWNSSGPNRSEPTFVVIGACFCHYLTDPPKSNLPGWFVGWIENRVFEQK